MTDPNKAAVTESNAEFVARIVASQPRIHTGYITISTSDMERLLQGFETAALIEERKLRPQWSSRNRCWHVEAINGTTFHIAPDLHTAVRAVADRIKEAS